MYRINGVYPKQLGASTSSSALTKRSNIWRFKRAEQAQKIGVCLEFPSIFFTLSSHLKKTLFAKTLVERFTFWSRQAKPDQAWPGQPNQARPGHAKCTPVWPCQAGPCSMPDKVKPSLSTPGRAWPAHAWLGRACPSLVRPDKA